MRFYPDIPHRFANRLVSDVLVVAAVVLLALLGLQVRHTVNRLVVVPQGVQETGSAVQSGFHDAAGALAAERYDPLIAAVLEDSGLRPGGGAELRSPAR